MQADVAEALDKYAGGGMSAEDFLAAMAGMGVEVRAGAAELAALPMGAPPPAAPDAACTCAFRMSDIFKDSSGTNCLALTSGSLVAQLVGHSGWGNAWLYHSI